MTLAELVLWERLKNRNLFKVKFRRQHPINRFIVDFYCHECKLVIEIDGDIHLEKDYKENDSYRDQEIERFGIKILRFSNDQVILNNKSVTDMIILKIAELTPLQGGRGVSFSSPKSSPSPLQYQPPEHCLREQKGPEKRP
jgi:very-short-patch-repair endonuclease